MYPVNPTFVDNYDPRIVYADPSTARQGNKLSPRAHELVDTIPDVYENTLSITAEPTMSFQFIFYGRILQMYGAAFPWLTGQQPWAQYTIDDDGETQPVLSAPYPLANFSLYVSALLPLTFHTLTVKVVNASVDGPFLFDYIAYGFLDASEDPNPPNSSLSASSQAPPTSSPSPSSSSPPMTSSATSAAGSSTVALAPTATVTAVAATSFPTGAVIGTVVGGVVLLAAVMLASLWVWRRMSKRRNVDGDRESIEPASDPGPPADIGLAVGVTRGEKGAPSSPHPRYAGHIVSAADQTVQHSSWTSRDSSERWPYAPGSSSVHRSASPLTLREKAGMSVVESEPRSSAAYKSRPSSWDILSDGRGGSTSGGGGEVGTAGRVASAVDEGVTRTTLHFVGPEASLHTGTQVDAPGREAPAGDTSAQAVQLESIPPPYSP